MGTLYTVIQRRQKKLAKFRNNSISRFFLPPLVNCARFWPHTLLLHYFRIFLPILCDIPSKFISRQLNFPPKIFVFKKIYLNNISSNCKYLSVFLFRTEIHMFKKNNTCVKI